MIKLQPNRSLLIILISLTLFLGSVIITQAAPPRSVGLLSFEVTALENAVSLDWETATELQTAGFIIKRSVNGGSFISLPDIGVPGFVDAAGNPAGFVIAVGGPAEGGIYQEIDNDVQAGNSYIYKLIEVENDNSEVELDMQSVTFGSAPTNTPTGQPLITNTPNPPATATSTPLPSSTVPSTATQATNNGTANVPPTATPTAPASLPTSASATQPQTAVNSSESGDEALTIATANNSVLAQTEMTETAVAPVPPEATTNGDNSYPGFQPQTEPTQEPSAPTPILLDAGPTAYPVVTRGIIGEGAEITAVPIIGSQTNDQSDGNLANLSQAAQGRDGQLGRIYLWVGFLISLLLFITTIVATILLFTRKRTQ